MNIDALIDDLEATFESEQQNHPTLEHFTVSGFDRVAFGKGFFTGFLAGTANWRLTALTEPLRLVPGKSTRSKAKLKAETRKLVGLWLRVNEVHRGRLLMVENGLLIFRTFCVPLDAIKVIELNVVDNQKQ
jgi:hypothetical protein